MMIWLYDIETFANYFAVIFKNVKSGELKEFIVFNTRNDIDRLYRFISQPDQWFVGYNNFYFDNQILNFIYKKHPQLTFEITDQITDTLFGLAMHIIEDGFSEFKYNLPFKSIDLMKLGGFQKSLKLIGVNLKWHKLQ